MINNKKCSKFSFCRNCLVAYLLVGICSALIADFHKNFQISSQSANAANFSRVMSLTVAKSVKNNFSK